MNLTEFCRRAIGVPFVPLGRDYDGWDCYGLAVCAWHDVAGVDLPDFAYHDVKSYRLIASIFQDQIAPFWREVPAPEPMAVAAIYRRGLVIHAGLVVPGRRILHVESGIETCSEPLSSFRVEGFYAPCYDFESVQG